MSTRTVMRLMAVLSLLAVAMASMASSAPTAAARVGSSVSLQGIFDAQCSGQSSSHVIKYYTANDGMSKPLRCGTVTTRGYRYIDDKYFDGYTSLMEQQVQYTLNNGAANPQGGGIVWWVNSGHIVSVDTNSSSGNGIIDVLQLSPNQIEELGLRDGAEGWPTTHCSRSIGSTNGCTGPLGGDWHGVPGPGSMAYDDGLPC